MQEVCCNMADVPAAMGFLMISDLLESCFVLDGSLHKADLSMLEQLHLLCCSICTEVCYLE